MRDVGRGEAQGVKFKLSSEELFKQRRECCDYLYTERDLPYKGGTFIHFMFPVALSQVPAIQLHQQAFTEQVTEE